MNSDIVSLDDSDDNSNESDSERVPSPELPPIAFAGNSKNTKKRIAESEKLNKKQRTEEIITQKTATHNVIYKPGECMKYMNIEVHPSLSHAWYFADVLREAEAAGARVLPAPDLCDEGLLVWSRTVPQNLTNVDGQLGLSSSKERCARALYVACAENIAEYVCRHTLSAPMAQICELAGCAVTLVVFGVKDYLKNTQGRSRRRSQGTSRIYMTENDLEMAFTDLLVSTSCDVVVVNTPNELALFIVQMTKAIAEAPHKMAKRAIDEKAEFYMRGDNKNCVAVDNNGNGLKRLWQQMVAVLPSSSLEVSRAVCALYKSPLELFEELQSVEGVGRVADIEVDRSKVPGSRGRRLGPEFARKLQILLTSEDGDMLID